MAAKLTLTKDARAKLVDALRTPITVTEACALAGVPRSTFYDWMSRGAMGEEPFAALAAEVQRAQAESSKELLDIARAQASEDPGQLRWLMGLRNPRAYGKEPERVDVMEESFCGVGADRQLELVASNPKVIAAVLAAQAKKLGKGD